MITQGPTPTIEEVVCDCRRLITLITSAATVDEADSFDPEDLRDAIREAAKHVRRQLDLLSELPAEILNHQCEGGEA